MFVLHEQERDYNSTKKIMNISQLNLILVYILEFDIGVHKDGN